jgi:hypothetical protein
VLLARRFEPGTELFIEYGDGTNKPPKKLPTRVIRVQSESNGHWIHGCQFSKPLGERQLAEIVKLFLG